MKYQGYCIYNNIIDKENDTFLPNSLISKQNVSIFLEHNKSIGVTTSINEDKKGIFIKFNILKKYEIYVKNHPYLSIGFVTNKFHRINNNRYIIEFKLIEISIVKFPVQENTKFFFEKNL
ncbi:hypothetical protein AB836_01930 [Rickettsiales bacterium (ex Bugula neritina AB1)]|nr:hypothetical protein AB836_01930 [Rickettsiales bacterium (ex Bugula neritina AB1)]